MTETWGYDELLAEKNRLLDRVEALERALTDIVRRADAVRAHYGPSDPPEAPEIAAARAALRPTGELLVLSCHDRLVAELRAEIARLERMHRDMCEAREEQFIAREAAEAQVQALREALIQASETICGEFCAPAICGHHSEECLAIDEVLAQTTPQEACDENHR